MGDAEFFEMKLLIASATIVMTPLSVSLVKFTTSQPVIP